MKLRLFLITGVSLSIFMLHGPTMAQMTCDDYLTHSTYARATVLKPALFEIIHREFDILMSEEKLSRLDQLVNGTGRITKKNQMEFIEAVAELDWVNDAQRKEASVLLGRKITFDQAIGLKMARALGRTEPGRNTELPGFSGNYTGDQIRRKDRILELAGFSISERFELMADKLVEDILSNYSAQNLFRDPPPTSAAQAEAMNDEVFRALNYESAAVSPGPRKDALSKSEARQLYDYLNNFPLFQELSTNKKYDPDGKTGFCFGRAFIADIESRRFGLPKGSIKKAWAVGEITTHITWRFHVTLIVKAEGGGWWTLDRFFQEGPLKLEEWFARMKKFNASGDLRLHVTESARFGPSNSQRYTKEELASAVYNDYFTTLLNYFHEKSIEQKNEKIAKAEAAARDATEMSDSTAAQKKVPWYLRIWRPKISR